MSIYLDHAATTPLDPVVLEAMLPWLQTEYGNASSVHTRGRNARFAVEDARARIAELIGAEEGEIIFTSGATEANNTALKGLLKAGDHFITCLAEHEAILEPAKALEKQGVTVSFLYPTPEGAVSITELAAALRPETRLISLMYANNEVGTCSPISSIAALCQAHQVLFHCDAVQALGLFQPQVKALNFDLMSASAHKFYGPKGIGFLYVRNGLTLQSVIHGGAQERRRRGGTENVAAIVGMVTALELAYQTAKTQFAHLNTLKTQLRALLNAEFTDTIKWNTPDWPHETAPHILNFSFLPLKNGPIDGEMLLLNMDLAGVYVSSGSACTSGAVEPSHVLQAMGVPDEVAEATLRFSLGKDTTQTDIETAVAKLAQIMARMTR